MKLVLDTQVWVDWLVFEDPGTAFVRRLHADGAEIVIDAACAAELERVLLTYPLGRKGPDAARRSACLARARTIFSLQACEEKAARLPRCADRDDQKFLELARDAGADYLVTRDEALLDLAKARSGSGTGLPFAIVRPEALAAPVMEARLGLHPAAYLFAHFVFEACAPKALAKTVRRLVREHRAGKRPDKQSTHLFVLVSSLAVTDALRGEALWDAAAQAGAYLYVVDPPALVALVDEAVALAADERKIGRMVAFDFLLLERFNRALAEKPDSAKPDSVPGT